MKLPSYIKSYPFFWGHIQFLNRIGADAMYPFIFVRNDIYRDLQTTTPQPKSLALLAHEKFHLQRQKEQGPLMFAIKYILFPKYRINEELLAYKKQREVLQKYNQKFDDETIAKILSSWMYLWAISYEKALQLLRKKQ